jgi:DNA helicase-2/ATP-dependent DNA helicase PcrA
MEKLSKKRNKIKIKIQKTKKKLLLLQNKLIDLEKNMAQFNPQEIAETIPLNDQQKEIVHCNSKNILVIACPGSGKTHTLISRYVHLVTIKKNNPERIVLITFTKKAGQEMSNRINNVVPNKLPLYVGTLHGLAYRILHDYHKISSTVLDENDSKAMLMDMVDEPLDAANMTNEEIDFIKKKIPEIVMKASCSYPVNLSDVIRKTNLIKYQNFIEQVYLIYQTKKKEQGLSDFSDLMVEFSKFLDTQDGQEFIKKIDYLFFDEYQDINPIQNYILLKFYNKTNIMAVGDDSQAIYSFRGSNIKFINNFEKNFSPAKIYKLEINYRSSPRIVDFCQDIISHNDNKFNKNVTANQEKLGSKPQIISQNISEQYKWVIEDIKKNISNGKKYSDMVILARKNKCIDDIEILLMKNKIPCIKQIGLSLLNKNHVKDFIAFVTILINNKSVLHWKRILALHKNIRDANKILDHGENIYDSIKYFMSKSKLYKKCLEDLDNFLIQIKKIKKPIEQTRFILEYLQQLWTKKKSPNIDAKVEDIRTLMNYLNDLNLEEFISELYLNIEIDETEEDNLLLSTVHGSKGLEWEYVYLIDMNNKDFPLTGSNYFTDQLEQMEEERRLFYVASSRAKKYLTITYGEDKESRYKILMSAFIREVNIELYSGININIDYFQLTGKVYSDVNTYLRNIGFSKLNSLLKNIPVTKTKLYDRFDIPKYLDSANEKFILSNFFNYLIPKIIKNDFDKKVNKLKLDFISSFPNFSKKALTNYIDPYEDWIDNLKSIFYIATFNNKNKEGVELYKKFLISKNSIKFYKELQNKLYNYLKSLKIKKIQLNKKVNYKSIMSSIKLLTDDHIIDLRYSENDSNTINNICQAFIQGFLMKKKNIQINKISIFNVILGEIFTYDTSNINFSTIQKIIYKN